MTLEPIEIGTRKLRKIGGAHSLTIPLTAVQMLQLKPGDIMRCSLNGDTLEIKRDTTEE